MIEIESHGDTLTMDMDLRHGVVEITVNDENIVVGYWQLVKAVEALIPTQEDE